MDKRNWKIIYSDYSGMEKKAIELVSREMGRFINRDKGVFTLHVLACEAGEALPDTNAVVIGRWENSKLIRAYVERDEIPNNGYIVRVVDNPENHDLKLCIIAGDTKRDVFYGAVDFVDDYFACAAPRHGGLRMADEIFEQKKMPDYCHVSSPKFKTRSIFTWGQPINDYRSYIENMARLKLNQLIIWNDYVPINANDIVDYAHEYGIDVIWGYAWGWKDKCGEGDYLKTVMSNLCELKENVIKEYKEKYSCIKGDGIYFQSFTEVWKTSEDGKIIAETVADFVNDTARELLSLYPNLKIQFGLHAMSVKDNLNFIAKVDERIEILWEDCGAFPYDYNVINTAENFEETVKFTEEIIKLRPVNPIGLVYKGQMTMDWTRFVNQSGPYIMGMESEEIIHHDIEMMRPIWRNFQAEWLTNGMLAQQMAKKVYDLTGGKVNMNMAGTFSGGVWLSMALTAEIFWNPMQDWESLLQKVAKRQYIKMA